MNKTEKFELIYERYANDVYRLSLYLLKDETKAQDITQRAFENIYKRLQESDEESVCNQLLIEAKRLAKNQDTKEVRK
jgi:DNA-directed RNA polymerase specialized sigma24 family protein